MSRKYLYGLLLGLLFLLPPTSFAQSLSRYEYWFDDDFANRKTGSLSGKVATIDTSIETESLELGMHRLNLRVLQSDGKYSAVTMSYFIKLFSGEAKWLEYWFDGNIQNSKRIAGTKASTGNDYVFVSELDIDSLSPGHHRLYYRAVSDDGQLSSAVLSEAVIVKSQYNIAPENVKMKAFTIAVDNEEPLTIQVNKEDEVILNPYTLNLRDLKAGNHTLKAHFWNTANAGVALEQAFTVSPSTTPSITLSAQENDGQVRLKFNSIPNDVNWKIARTDANGVNVKIDGKEQSCYPSEITSIDNPPAGSYTYKARGYYIDANGERKSVTSNEVKVNVATSKNGPFGKICGDIRVGGNPLWGERWTVIFSDGDTLKSDGYGLYYRDKIPVGTVLEIRAQARDYHCDPVTVTIKEGTNTVRHRGIFDKELVKSRYTNDLVFDSHVEFEPRSHMKFKVRNRTRLPWRGKLRIVTGRKDYVDNPPQNPLEQTNWTQGAQQLAGSVAPFAINDYLQYDYSEEIHLLADESKEVYIKHNIPLTSPPTVKDELYYFFVESQDEYGTKLVATNDDYNIKENPLVQLVNNGQYDAEKQGEEDVETCIAMIMGLCSTVKEFDGRLGDMSRCMEELQESLGDALTYDDLAGVIQRSGSYVYIRDRVPSWRFMRNLYGEDRRYLGMVNSVRDNISKEVRACKNTLTYLKKVQECIDMVKSYNQWADMTELERTGAIAEKIINLSESQFPFAKILKMYLDVTRTTIHNINNLAEKWYANHDYDTFFNGRGEIYAGSDFKFDIKVKKKTWITTYFSAEDIKERISSVEINCIGHITGNAPLKCTATYTPEVENKTLRLRRTKIIGESSNAGGVVPIEDMWMTIWWSNGRVSHVPIRNGKDMKGNGVKHDKNHYTITFQSATCETEHMADIIFLDD